MRAWPTHNLTDRASNGTITVFRSPSNSTSGRKFLQTSQRSRMAKSVAFARAFGQICGLRKGFEKEASQCASELASGVFGVASGVLGLASGTPASDTPASGTLPGWWSHVQVVPFGAQYGSSGCRKQHCSLAPQTALPQLTLFGSLPSDVSGGFPVAMPIRLAGRHRLRLVGK